ncbi:hypothetical protein EJ02DRAFT_14398 [Clathrospora elynae]|uniref:Uncharacterized protein n=1 Tax=Clathrospora elynae TaxID=706981 RepID=A0A6A5T5E4_9PLEO|nr:hypothetical protein EJ02DRAFT_14398 [Clathrospora elynae]
MYPYGGYRRYLSGRYVYYPNMYDAYANLWNRRQVTRYSSRDSSNTSDDEMRRSSGRHRLSSRSHNPSPSRSLYYESSDSYETRPSRPRNPPRPRRPSRPRSLSPYYQTRPSRTPSPPSDCSEPRNYESEGSFGSDVGHRGSSPDSMRDPSASSGPRLTAENLGRVQGGVFNLYDDQWNGAGRVVGRAMPERPVRPERRPERRQ